MCDTRNEHQHMRGSSLLSMITHLDLIPLLAEGPHGPDFYESMRENIALVLSTRKLFRNSSASQRDSYSRSCCFTCAPHVIVLQRSTSLDTLTMCCSLLLLCLLSNQVKPFFFFFSIQNISVGAFCIHNLFFTYQPSFPLFGFLSSHDALPIVLCSLTLSPHLPLVLQLSPLERQLFSLRPDERLWRTIKMLFKCKGVCVRVRDISC